MFNGKKVMPSHIKDSIYHHTSFLDFDAPIKLRVFYLLSGLTEQRRCASCGKTLKTKENNFCSYKCSSNNVITKEKRKNTVFNKFGVDNVFQSQSIKSKMAKTNLKKYGVENPAKNEKIKQKIRKKSKKNSKERMKKTKETVQKKYGVDYIGQSEEIKKKRESTVIEKYGVKNFFLTETFREKSIEGWMHKYGVDNPSKSPDVIDKIRKTKEERYNDGSFNNRKKANETMYEKYGCHSARKHWPIESRKLLENIDQLELFVKDKTINYAAEQLGIGSTHLRDVLYSNEIISYHGRKNQYEEFVKSILEDENINFVQNDRTLLNGKEIDFLLPEYNKAIEINGVFWHSELIGKDKNYHLSKTVECENNNIQLLHFWDYQFDKNPILIKSMILSQLQRSKRIYARKTKVIKDIDRTLYNNFLEENHLSGAVNSSIRYGLEYKDNLVAVMGFGKSRFNSNEMEMYRFASLSNYSVVGGAGKLFKTFLADRNPKSVISFANRDISQGTLYERLGFKLMKVIPPSYHYFKNRSIHNRLKFQKHKLESQLELFDNSLTEWENMQNNGYNRFWNTGQLKYEFSTI